MGWIGRAAAVALLLTVAGRPAVAAPEAELWSRWLSHDAAATATIDHSAWDRLLRTYLVVGDDGVARLPYGRIAAADRAALDAYVGALSAVPISRYNRAEQRAFWINLYNALTVQLVLRNYPVDSIRDIGFLSFGPWGRKLVAVEGEPVSLDDIEHRILRPIWRDARLHYALNCAAFTCPNLQRRAFTAANGEALLDGAARAYVNDARGVRFEGDALIVSSIYVWYADDFGGEQGILAHLRRYAGPALRARLQGVDEIDDHTYDWSLNDLPR